MRVGNLSGIRRLPIYLNLLRAMREDGVEHASAAALADMAGLVASVVRKDLEMTGASGTTGRGFGVATLIADIESFLGWDNPNDAFLVGAGNLGSALLGHRDLRSHGVHFVAAFDTDPAKVGLTIHGVDVLPVEKLVSLGQRMHIRMGILCVPNETAQEAADLLVDGGITRIWSFAPNILKVPKGVTVQREDLSAGLAELLVKSMGLGT